MLMKRKRHTYNCDLVLCDVNTSSPSLFIFFFSCNRIISYVSCEHPAHCFTNLYCTIQMLQHKHPPSFSLRPPPLCQARWHCPDATSYPLSYSLCLHFVLQRQNFSQTELSHHLHRIMNDIVMFYTRTLKQGPNCR